VFSFAECDYERAIKQFLQECFNLPSSFPMSIAKLFLGVDDLIMQSFRARQNFFNRILTGRNSNASLAAMGMDRGLLFPSGSGWNHEFCELVGDLLDFGELDLSSPASCAAARSDLCSELFRRRHAHFQSSSSSFILELFPSISIPLPFFEHLSQMPHESVRVVLIFFANLLQYTYFRSSTITCAFCTENITSRHLFVCSRIRPNPICDWSAFVGDFREGNFQNAVDRIFLVIQRWATLTNRFQPSLSQRLDEYFTSTQYNTRRDNSAWALAFM
jgi:hypothetical protein